MAKAGKRDAAFNPGLRDYDYSAFISAGEEYLQFWKDVPGMLRAFLFLFHPRPQPYSADS
jgi:hypothetical protein